MARLAPYAFMQELDNNGYPLVGGKIYTYEAGTTTPKATYTDAGATIANANPVILDGSGRAAIWLGDGAYKLVLKTAADVTIKTIDNITGESANAFGSNVNIITANTNITEAYANSALIASNTIALTLPPVAQAGQGFYFTIKNNGSGIVTIDPDAAELIDGAATKAIGAGYSALVICNGSAWYTFFLATVAAASDNTFTGANTFNGTTNLNGTTNIPDGTVSTYAKIASSVFASVAEAFSGTASKLINAATLSTLNQSILWVREEQASGTAGGTFTSGAWRTRTLNTVKQNGISGASLASNQITLPAGTYYIEAILPTLNTNSSQGRLQNITDASTSIIGQSGVTGATGGGFVFVRGVFTVPSSTTKVFEIQHQCTTTRATDGFGYASSFGTEVYSEVIIMKIG